MVSKCALKSQPASIKAFFRQLGYETKPRAPAIAVCIPGRGKWPKQHNCCLSHDLGTASAFQAPAPKNGWGQICIYFLHLCCATFQRTNNGPAWASYLPRLQGLCDQLQRRLSGSPAMDGRECISSCTQTSFLNFHFYWKIMEDPSLQNSQKKIEKVLTNTRTGSWPKPPHPLPLALVPHHRNACGQNQVPSMPRTFPVEQTFDESCLGKDTAHPIRFLDFYNPCPGLSLHQNNLAIMHRRTQPVAA